MQVKVVDLSTEYERLYFDCLQDWSDEIKEQGDRKERWYDRMKSKGLRVKLAIDDKGVVGGMIQYVPIEYSNAVGKDLYFVNCIWVHGHKEGRGDFRGRGMGKALLSAAEEDVKALGRKGLVTWGISLPFFMRAKWFKKQGYKVVDKEGILVLLWKPFAQDAAPPRWIRQRRAPKVVPGRVSVTVFVNGWCPAQNMVAERARRAAAEFKDKVVFTEVDTSDREVFLEYGILDALFIDDKSIRTGPPPSYAKIRRRILNRVRRLRTS
jgi:GNAT superfamily N-acetyltransferase